MDIADVISLNAGRTLESRSTADDFPASWRSSFRLIRSLLSRRGTNGAAPVANLKLLDMMHDATCVRSVGGVIEHWNRAAEQLYGWTANEAVGRVSHALFKTVFPAPLDRIEAQLLSTGCWEGELVHALKDGTRVTVASRWSVLGDQTSAPIAILEANTDVTEGKRAEAERLKLVGQLRAAQAALARVNRVTTLGVLAASIAHEVNQPLGAMVTSAASCSRWLAAQPPDFGKARRALERIGHDGRRASQVIERIRTLVQRHPPRRDRVEVNDAIGEVIALTRDLMRRNDVSLQTSFAQGLPPVNGDRIQLQQVIINLVVNAIEAMSAVGDRPRELAVRSAMDGQNAVRVEVRDSGPGVAPERARQIFEAFHTTKADGIGMGLSISHSIVEAHGGRLWVEPNAPHGAAFQFSLPVQEQ